MKFDNINSTFIIQTIFSFLDERKILELVKYNKNLQEKLDISLIDYKVYSGKYKIGEKNGKGQEFYLCNDKLLFDGKYLNGKRSGKGKEYNKDGELIYEGEYLNGKRDGHGKEYIGPVGGYRIYYEGEYLNGIKLDGIIYKVHNSIQDINYVSEIKNGQGYIQKGFMIYKIGEVIIEGEYKNGKLNGKGKEYYYPCYIGDPYEITFEGEYKNGKKWNGKVNINIEIIDKITDYSNLELKDGKGIMIEINCDHIFIGEFVNGEKNGKGKEYYVYSSSENKLFFEGEYKNGKKNGKGKEYALNNGQVTFDGYYKNGYKLKGKEYYENGKLFFEGDYRYGKKWNGKGYDKSGNIIFIINNGKGFIKEYFNYFDKDYSNYSNKETLKYEGEYLNGEKHGKGKEYNPYGEIIFEGEYLNGKRWNGKAKDKDFEGDYLNGKKWNGKVKEYNFEGNYLNGKKQGKIINQRIEYMTKSIPSYKNDDDDDDEIDELSQIDKNKCLIGGNKQKKKRNKLDDN